MEEITRRKKPCKKICFPDLEEAAEFVHYLRSRKGSKKVPIDIRYYTCNHCGNIHFTREAPRVPAPEPGGA